MKPINASKGKKIIEQLISEEKVTFEDLTFSINNDERICAVCGCSDLRACPDGCCWIDEDQKSIFGICSNCEDELERFQ